MASSAINNVGTGATSTNAATSASTVNAFRDADFLKIMMTEITNQNPLDPQDTSKLVDNVQKLQELANTTYQKYRSDITWAQQLMGETVSVQQQSLSPAEKQKQLDKGLKPDVGFAQVSGKVTSFRTIDQKIYVTVNDRDYPMDNVKQVVPESHNAQYLSQMADQLLGKQVGYMDTDGTQRAGQVTAVKYDEEANLMLQIGGKPIPFNKLTQIGVNAGG